MAEKIALFCSAGMSTSLLVQKMKEEAEKKGADYSISAYSLDEAPKFAPDADVILIGPQIRFVLEKFQRDYPDKPISAIEMRAYGLMDGKSVLEQAEKLLKKKAK